MSSNNENGLTEEDMFHAVKGILLKRNDLNKIRAELRTKITEILREHDEDSLVTILHSNDPLAIKKPNVILNKLILQYFTWYGYSYAAEVFSVEAGINHSEVDCLDIMSTMKNIDLDKDLPILLNIIMSLLIDA